MCTVTLERRDGELLLTMNRDELRARPPESPPELREEGRSPVVAPSDGLRGGTWIAVNAHGVAGCLLNGYPADPASPPPAKADAPSRGFILPELLRLGPWSAVQGRMLGRFDPRPYEGFTLVIAAPGGAVLYEWDGMGRAKQKNLEEPLTFTTSSGRFQEEAAARRREMFEAWRAAGAPRKGLLPEWHLLSPESERATAPIMERDLAATRSVSQVWIGEGGAATLRWWRVPVADPAQPDAEVVARATA